MAWESWPQTGCLGNSRHTPRLLGGCWEAAQARAGPAPSRLWGRQEVHGRGRGAPHFLALAPLKAGGNGSQQLLNRLSEDSEEEIM